MPFFSPVTSGGGGGSDSTTTQVFRYDTVLPTNTDGSLVYGQSDVNGIPYVNPGIYNTNSFAQALVAVPTSAGGIPLLSANAARTYLAIQNQDGTNPIWVSFGGTPVATAACLKIAAGAIFELKDSAICGSAISAISTGGTVNTQVIEAS